MDKPQTVAYEELRLDIASLINTSGVPAFIVKPIIKDLLYELEEIEKKQYEYDKAQYESYLMYASNEETYDKHINAEDINIAEEDTDAVDYDDEM